MTSLLYNAGTSSKSVTRTAGPPQVFMQAVVLFQHIVQELCESRGGRPELSVLTSLLASVDVKIY